jgi:hypothetical protein
MIVTTLDPSLLGDIDMPYSNHLIPDRLMVAHGFKRLGARLTTIATPTAASSLCSAPACVSASSPACTANASASTSPSPPCKSSTFATKQAANSAAASNNGPRATPASVRSPWRRRWSR